MANEFRPGTHDWDVAHQQVCNLVGFHFLISSIGL